jgi:exopolyphosphatase / guanosine-5'-triphosphate,3'-diphosphate pyrophosphatase
METVRRAVIDVGTNSIKLLVADITGRTVRPVWEGSQQTRLGQGFYETHRLQTSSIANTAQAVAAFVARAHDQGATSTRVIATSAARDAVNATELIQAIRNAAGLTVEIISGEQEADWAFQGVTADPLLAQHPLLLLDIGGGSTELILGHGRHQHFRKSYPLGTVRLLEKLPPDDPPRPEQLAACRRWLEVFLKDHVATELDPAMRQETRFHPKSGQVLLVGTGGTASILGCMEAGLMTFDRERLEGTRLTAERVRWHVTRLWSLPLQERREIIGLPPNRADVILTGAAIYEAVMQQFGFEELRLSTRGLRFAVVAESP